MLVGTPCIMARLKTLLSNMLNLSLNKWSDIDPLACEPEPGVGAEPEPGVEPEPEACSCETGAKGCNLNPWIDKKKGGTVVKLILFKHFWGWRLERNIQGQMNLLGRQECNLKPHGGEGKLEGLVRKLGIFFP